MPYVCTDGNVYLGEHACGRYHDGNQRYVRLCCVKDAQRLKELTLRNAITTSHTAYQLFAAAWNSLTDAERWIVGNIAPVYDHGPAGFVEVDMQAELAV